MARRKINLERLPSNDKDPVREDRDVSVVTTGGVKKRKNAGVANYIRDIGNALFNELFVPSLKTITKDFFIEGIRMLFEGNSPQPKAKGTHRSYNMLYRGNQNRGRVSVARTREVFDDLYFDRREDAELVLGRMMELIAEYGWATMGDLYTLAGLSTNFTHENYGWEDLRRCRVHYTTDGYLIDFPDPVHLR